MNVKDIRKAVSNLKPNNAAEIVMSTGEKSVELTVCNTVPLTSVSLDEGGKQVVMVCGGEPKVTPEALAEALDKVDDSWEVLVLMHVRDFGVDAGSAGKSVIRR